MYYFITIVLVGFFLPPPILLQTQISILFTSNWQGNNLTFITNIFKNCSDSFRLTFLSPNVSFLSPISSLIEERNRLSDTKSKEKNFRISEEKDNFFKFFNLNYGKPIEGVYPLDTDIDRLTIALVNRLYSVNTTAPKSNILIIVDNNKDPDRPEINNIDNRVTSLNSVNWARVIFLNYLNLDMVVQQIRKLKVYNIITFLSDPTVNSQLIKRMYLEGLMVWIYRWIIFDFLGGINYLADKKFQNGSPLNNVTIVTFAEDKKDGRQILLETVHKLIKNQTCEPLLNDKKLNQLFMNTDKVIKRKKVKLNLYQKISFSQMEYMGECELDHGKNSAPVLSPNLTNNNFILTKESSLQYAKQKIIKIGFVELEPYSFTKDGKRVGFMVDLLTEIFNELKVRFEFVPIKETLVAGRMNPNTLEYDGLLGIIQKGVVDLLTVPIILNIDHLNSFDFVINLLSGHFSGLYKPHVHFGFTPLLNYVNPFVWQVWLTFLGIAMAVTLVLALSDYLYPDIYARYHLSMSLFFSISSLTHGAYFDPPEKRASRIIISFWWIFCLLVIVIWVANYAALLSQERTEQELSTVFSLLNQKRFKYGTLDDDLLFYFLKKDPDIRAQTILRLMQNHMPNGTVKSLNDSIKLVEATWDQFVLIYDNNILEHLAYSRCLTVFGKWRNFEYGIPLHKNSELTVIISQKTLEKRTNGRTKELRLKYWPENGSSCKSKNILDITTQFLQKFINNPFTNAMDATYLIGIFTILVLGGVCALILASIEKLIRYIIDRRKKKKERSRFQYTLDQLQL